MCVCTAIKVSRRLSPEMEVDSHFIGWLEVRCPGLKSSNPVISLRKISVISTAAIEIKRHSCDLLQKRRYECKGLDSSPLEVVQSVRKH